MDDDIIGWFTMGGQHIPIRSGESKQDALDRHKKEVAQRIKREEHDKQKQIAKNEFEQEERNLLKGGNQKYATATNKTQSEHANIVKELSSKKYADGTYDVGTKQSVDFEDGYQVTFCQIGDNYSDEEYAKLCNEFLVHSSNGRVYAGKFEDTPEISFHVKNQKQAIHLAKKYNQISIWDWKSGDQIITGGTGKREKVR